MLSRSPLYPGRSRRGTGSSAEIAILTDVNCPLPGVSGLNNRCPGQHFGGHVKFFGNTFTRGGAGVTLRTCVLGLAAADPAHLYL